MIAQRREQAQDDWKKRPQLASPHVPVCTCTSSTALLSLSHHVSSSSFFWPCAELEHVAVAPANLCPVDLGRHSWACAPSQWPWCQPFRTPFPSLSESSALASAHFPWRLASTCAACRHRMRPLRWSTGWLIFLGASRLHRRIVCTQGVLLREFAAVPHWWPRKGQSTPVGTCIQT
jgi:hypothetical protein